MNLGLYIHIPFCETRCHFCAFYLEIAQDKNIRSFLQAWEREIQWHATHHTLKGRSLDTVYFGGGTPTALTPSDLSSCLLLITRTFGLQPGAEVTVEAHPDTVTEQNLALLHSAGFNRLSIGLQSLNHDDLVNMGRLTKCPLPHRTIETARQAGFHNINVDLIYGVPGQNMEGWRGTLRSALDGEPDHMSCYALTVEEGTKLDRSMRSGLLEGPDPHLQNEMQDLAVELLEEAGLSRYEISNFSRPGFACRHNQLYWTGGEYLGLGPSAQSYVRGHRFGIVDNLQTYSEILTNGQLPVTEVEQLTPDQVHREAAVFGLRLMEGVDGRNPNLVRQPEFKRALKHLMAQGLVQEWEGRIRLTPQGQKHADTIAVVLL